MGEELKFTRGELLCFDESDGRRIAYMEYEVSAFWCEECKHHAPRKPPFDGDNWHKGYEARLLLKSMMYEVLYCRQCGRDCHSRAYTPEKRWGTHIWEITILTPRGMRVAAPCETKPRITMRVIAARAAATVTV